MKKFFACLTLSAVALAGCGGDKAGSTEKAGGASGDVKWPTKTVTVNVPYNAGGDTDTYARLMGMKLEQKLGQTFVVVNMTGGSGIVAAKTTMAEKPNGYTILFNHTGASLVQEATGAADFSYTNDFTNVATIAQDNTYVLVAKKDKYANLEAMIADAKANPDKVRYSQVYGSVTHYVSSKMEELMGIRLNKLDVGAGAAERLSAFMGGQVDLLAANYINVRDYVEKGDFTVLGVFSAERVAGMDSIPTFKEQGYDIVTAKNYELKFPKGTDAAIVEKLSAAVKEVSEDPEFKEQLAKYYAVPFYRDAETMSKEDMAEVEALKAYFKK